MFVDDGWRVGGCPMSCGGAVVVFDDGYGALRRVLLFDDGWRRLGGTHVRTHSHTYARPHGSPHGSPHHHTCITTPPPRPHTHRDTHIKTHTHTRVRYAQVPVLAPVLRHERPDPLPEPRRPRHLPALTAQLRLRGWWVDGGAWVCGAYGPWLVGRQSVWTCGTYR